MSERVVLVTGATGNTGRYTVGNLLSKGAAVRALVRKDDERAARLREAGAETVVGDLLDLDAVSAALHEIDAAYFCYPIRAGLLDAAVIFAQAARDADVRAIVNMSQISARRDAASTAARNHWLVERLFDQTNISITHLRPTYFAQWLLYPINGGTGRGEIRLPFGKARHAPIAAEDQARLIANVLVDPAPHAGQTYRLFGPVEMDYNEIAAAVSETLGRPIVYKEISAKEYETHLSAIYPAHLVQHLCETAADYRNGIFSGTNDVIERVTGTKPMTVQEFVAAHRDAFAQ